MAEQNKNMTILEKPYLEQFKILLKATSKDRGYQEVVRVEREDDGRFVYVCTEGHRIHTLRTADNFGFFEPGRNYRFKVSAKAVSFEREAPDGFPNWRRVIPGDTRFIAKAELTKLYRSHYLAGFYRAGIFIQAGFLADMESVSYSQYSVHAGEDLGKAIVLKNEEKNTFDFEAVIMPLRNIDTAGAFVAERA